MMLLVIMFSRGPLITKTTLSVSTSLSLHDELGRARGEEARFTDRQ